MKPITKVIITITILIVLTLGFYYISKTVSAVTGKSIMGWLVREDTCDDPESLECFAKCLTDNGVVLYINGGCPHCKAQKEDFEDAVQYLDIVECAQYGETCSEAGVTHVPSWGINGKIYVGRKALQELSDLSGCPI